METLSGLPDEELPEGYHAELMKKLQAEVFLKSPTIVNHFFGFVKRGNRKLTFQSIFSYKSGENEKSAFCMKRGNKICAQKRLRVNFV